MGKHRRITRLRASEALEISVLSTLALSESLYGQEYVSSPLYTYVILDAPAFNHNRGVKGLQGVGIDADLVKANCATLMPKSVVEPQEGFAPEFLHIRREAILLTEDMGERIMDISHMLLAEMRETEIFSGVDKSIVRRYKADFCKAPEQVERIVGRQPLLVPDVTWEDESPMMKWDEKPAPPPPPFPAHLIPTYNKLCALFGKPAID